MWSFLYTLYLVAVYAIFGPHPLAARLIQALIVGLLHPWLAYQLGKRVFNKKVGLAAAGLTGVYIYFIYYSATLMTEPFYITAILGTLYLTMRLAEVRQDVILSYKLALGLGLCLGVTVLLRQLFLFFIPFLFLWLWWVWWQRNRKLPVLQTAFAGIILVAMILPFTIYNYTRFDRFVLLNTNAGYAFFWANHPIYGTHFEDILPPEMGTYQDLIPETLRHLDEAALDQELLRRGLGFVMDDPLRYLKLSISRIPAYFKFWPSPESGLISNLSRVGSFALMLPFMLYGLFLSFRAPHSTPCTPESQTWKPAPFTCSPKFLLYLFVVIYTLIHLLSWALIRYRLPVDAVLLLFAGLAFLDLAERFRVRPRSVVTTG